MNIEQLRIGVEEEVIRFHEKHETEVAELEKNYEKLNLLIEEGKKKEDVQQIFNESFLISSGEMYNDKVEEMMEYVESGELHSLESYGIDNATEVDSNTLESLVHDAAAELITKFTSDFSRDIRRLSEKYGLIPTIQDNGADTDLVIRFTPNENIPGVMLAYQVITKEDSEHTADFEKEVIEAYGLSFDFPEAPLTQENLNHFMDAYKKTYMLNISLTTARKDLQTSISFLEDVEKLNRYLTMFQYDFYGKYWEYQANGIFLV